MSKNSVIEFSRSAIKGRIIDHFCPLGWKVDIQDHGVAGYVYHGIINASGDYRVSLDGDYGYTWELQRFDDPDVDGIATARWVHMGIEGDTLEELKSAIEKISDKGFRNEA